MKSPTHYRLLVFATALSLLITNQLSARPIGFSELSLMVRMHQSEAEIRGDVADRKLLHPLTQPQEDLLKKQGASDSLIQSLRDSRLVASKEEAAAAEAAPTRHANGASTEEQNYVPRVDVFEVAFGHPINLSRWGGLDYEIAFYSYRFAGEDHIMPALIDQVGTKTIVSRTIPLESEVDAFGANWFPTNGVRNWRFTPYNGVDYDNRGDFRDPRSINFSDSVAVTSRSMSRAIAIDWRNPQFIDGQPYTFYPVYVGPGVSLYFISANSESARVAVLPNDVGVALINSGNYH
jgi:hypothetical protein